MQGAPRPPLSEHPGGNISITGYLSVGLVGILHGQGRPVKKRLLSHPNHGRRMRDVRCLMCRAFPAQAVIHSVKVVYLCLTPTSAVLRFRFVDDFVI